MEGKVNLPHCWLTMNDYKEIFLPLKPLIVGKLHKHYQNTKSSHTLILDMYNKKHTTWLISKQIAHGNYNEYINLEQMKPINFLPFTFMLSNILRIIMIDALSSLNSPKNLYLKFRRSNTNVGWNMIIGTYHDRGQIV